MADIGEALRRATAYYQPIVDLNTGDVLGVETLVRFVDPDGTVHSPGDLIERIEESRDDYESLMTKLVADMAHDVTPIFTLHPRFYVSVNVPPVMLGNGVIKRAVQTVNLTGFANRFVCELTERQILTNLGRQALAEARRFGVRVALDDFGTGHSGIKQLLGLDFDILKIDKSQVDPLMQDPAADRLLRGVVALAGALHVKVVAEGVETHAQAFFLRAAGVDAGQGWLWSKAVPGSELARVVQTGFPWQRSWQTPAESRKAEP